MKEELTDLDRTKKESEEEFENFKAMLNVDFYKDVSEFCLEKVEREKELSHYKALLDVDFYPADPELYKAFDRCLNLEISVEEFSAILKDFIAQGRVKKAKVPEEIMYTLSPEEADELFKKINENRKKNK